MNSKRYLSACSIIVLTLSSSALAQTPPLPEPLKQYVSNLQGTPNDVALREKIIRHVQAIRKAPAVPEEAERFMARGTAAVRAAKDVNDFKDAAAEFEKATLTAPWLASAYYNLGISQDRAGMYADAIRNLKLYLLAAPDAPDAKQVKTLIYEIEYRQEKAAKESSPEAIAARQQREYAEWLGRIDGRRYTAPGDEQTTGVLDVKGRVLITGIIVAPGSPLVGPRGYTEHNHHEIHGREAAGPVYDTPDLPGGTFQEVYIISEDGDRITRQLRFGDGTIRERIYLWQR